MKFISCQNVVKTYESGRSRTAALRGVSFEIERGEFAAVMGPSGSGKSTLMHILGLLSTPTSGRYVFRGNDTSALSEQKRAALRRNTIGFVFQAFYLLPRLTVLRNVMLPFAYSNTPDRIRVRATMSALSATGLPRELWERLPNELSGGQMQRVAVARALAHDPELIIADEPTGNLDSVSGKNVMDTLSNLNAARGTTLIVITHDRAVASYAKRIITIKDGILVS